MALASSRIDFIQVNSLQHDHGQSVFFKTSSHYCILLLVCLLSAAPLCRDFTPCLPSLSLICFLIYNQCLRNRYRCSTTNWKPFDGILVEERPRRYDDDEGKSGASEGDEYGKLDVLQEISDEEGDSLVDRQRVSKSVAQWHCFPPQDFFL